MPTFVNSIFGPMEYANKAQLKKIVKYAKWEKNEPQIFVELMRKSFSPRSEESFKHVLEAWREYLVKPNRKARNKFLDNAWNELDLRSYIKKIPFNQSCYAPLTYEQATKVFQTYEMIENSNLEKGRLEAKIFDDYITLDSPNKKIEQYAREIQQHRRTLKNLLDENARHGTLMKIGDPGWIEWDVDPLD